VTIRGIELAEKIKKQQFNLKPLTEKAITASEMWAVVLAGSLAKIIRPTKTYTLEILHQNQPDLDRAIASAFESASARDAMNSLWILR
jgi:uncharacterized protein with gpF-like domain